MNVFFRRTGLDRLSRGWQQTLLTSLFVAIFEINLRILGYNDTFNGLGWPISIGVMVIFYLTARCILPFDTDLVKVRIKCINCGAYFPVEEVDDPDTPLGVKSFYGQCSSCSTLWRLMDGGKE